MLSLWTRWLSREVRVRGIGHRPKCRKRRKPGIVTPGIESLENKALLTGVVAVGLSAAGDFTLAGDNAANDVRVDVANGDVTVTGNEGTQLNIGGMIFDADVAVALSTIDGVTIPNPLQVQNVSISGAGGNDKFVVSVDDDLAVSGSFGVNLGSGDDAFTLVGRADISIGGNLSIDGSSGNDFIAVGTTGDAVISVGNDLLVKGRDGADGVFLGNVDPLRDLLDDLDGVDPDILAAVNNFRNLPNDSADFGEQSIQIGDDLILETGNSDDIVGISSVGVRDDARLHTGFGHGDILAVDGLFVGDDLSLIGKPPALPVRTVKALPLRARKEDGPP